MLFSCQDLLKSRAFDKRKNTSYFGTVSKAFTSEILRHISVKYNNVGKIGFSKTKLIYNFPFALVNNLNEN